MNRSDRTTETLILILIALLAGIWFGLHLRNRPQPSAPPPGPEGDTRPPKEKFRQRGPMATPHKEPIPVDFREGVDRAAGQ